jgi:predicted acetyltransferase
MSGILGIRTNRYNVAEAEGLAVPQTQTQVEYIVEVVPPSRLHEVADLWRFCFGMTTLKVESELDFAKSAVSKLLAAFSKDGAIAAVVGLIDFDMHVLGQWVRCGGITSVATAPAHRAKKLTPILLKHCLADMHSEGVGLTALFPFSYPYYEKLGWAISEFRYGVELPLSYLKSKVGRRRHSYAEIRPSDYEQLLPIHAQWIEQFNLTMQRSPYRWERQLKISECKIFVRHDGYMIWNLTNSQTAKSLVVSEWVYLSEDAFLDGLALLSGMDSQVASVRWTAPEIELITRLGVSEPQPAYNIQPGMMCRTVNVDTLRRLFPEKLHSASINDRLGISGQDAEGVSPGAVIQELIGFWRGGLRFNNFSTELF